MATVHKPRSFRASVKPGDVLAIKAGALDIFYEEPIENRCEVIGGVAIVPIHGPLVHRADWWWDSYESILCRFAGALEDSDVSAIVLDIDSPGGDAAGLYETVRMMRRMKERSAKAVYAYSNESAYSSAYALSTVADQIFLPVAAGVGSVGVRSELYDQTKMNERIGINVVVISSGTRKADGHPDIPISEEAKARVQARVDDLARQFFDLVAEARPVSAKKVASYQAMTFYGDEAVAKGLADAVLPFRKVLKLAQLAPGVAKPVSSNASGSGKETPSMSTKKASKSKATARLKTLIATARAELATAKTSEERKSLRAFVASLERKLATEIASVDAKYKKSKKTTVEEEEDDGGAEESESGSEAGSESGSEAGEESESGSGAEESEAGSSDGGSSTGGSTDSSMSTGAEGDDARTGLHTKDRLLRMCRKITGKTSIAEVMGTLDAWDRSRREVEKLSKEVRGMKSKSKRAEIDTMLEAAIDEGRIAPGQKDSMRAYGEKQGRKSLRAFLAASPPIYGRSHREAATGGNPKSGVTAELGEACRQFGVTPEQIEAMQNDVLPNQAPLTYGATSIPLAIPGVQMNGRKA